MSVLTITSNVHSGPTISKEISSGIWSRAERSHLTFKVTRGGREKIPILQGKEQWLYFTGAAVKRYHTMSEVRETRVRW